jgi:uncharacterized protein
MNAAIEEFVKGRRIALVGVSRSGKKFGNAVCTELKARGYEVLVVHPEAQEIDGQRCYPNLAALPLGQVDGVVICVPSRQVPQVMLDAVSAGIKNIWVQQGADSPEVQTAARELGVTPVTGKCILMYAQPVGSIHAWHRGFARLVGQY